uniref:tRNA/rRNA methyltransferase SpoU type domain-containing protein n=1 Tax=Globisporangium ultimum (strain ATCC 200006 / CBS 805.95 / DAOM BR144) TaxID=431595 RepID=K3WMZ4_GLOUD
MGIQHVWLINPNERQVKKHKSGGTKKITKGCSVWLNMREFSSISDCVDALQEDGRTIWATDLSPQALPLTMEAKPAELPPKLAVVIGRETDGVSEEMLHAAEKRIYFPMFGFTESLNLSVATALVLQRLFDWFPAIRGDLSDEEKQEIRKQWYPQIVNNPTLAQQTQHWVENTQDIRHLDDLRRKKLDWNEKWVPKRVKQRELDMPEVQERLGKRENSTAVAHAGNAD